MIDELQYSLLPAGFVISFLVVGWLLFFVRQSTERRAAIVVLLFGLVASLLLVALLTLDLRLPWVAACTDCLASYPLYSYAFTFVQAFGWFGGLAIVALRLTRRRSIRHA